MLMPEIPIDPSPSPADLLVVVARSGAGPRADADAVQEAMSRLYDLYAPRVFGLAVRVTRDRDLAEDVTQEVFVSLWQTAGTFDPARGSATNWILCLAHRRAVERVRSVQRSRDRDTSFTARNHTAAFDSTQDAALGSIEGAALRAVMGSLAPDHRQVLELAYFDGRTHTEISTMLALPLGTAKSRIRTALHCLRALVPSPTDVAATA